MKSVNKRTPSLNNSQLIEVFQPSWKQLPPPSKEQSSIYQNGYLLLAISIQQDLIKCEMRGRGS